MVNKLNTYISFQTISIILIILITLISLFIDPYIHLYSVLVIILLLYLFKLPELGYTLFITDGLILSSYFFACDIKSISILPFLLIFLILGIFISKNYCCVFFKDKQNIVLTLVIFSLGILLLFRTLNNIGGNYGLSKSFYYLLRNFLFFLVPVLFFNSEKSLKNIHFAGIIISILLIFTSLFAYFQFDHLSDRLDPSGRRNVIWFGRAMGLSVIWFYFGLLNCKSQLQKILYIALISLSMFLLNVAGSRGPFVSLILSIIFFGFFTKRYSFKTKVIVFISLSFVSLQIFTYFFSNIMNRFTDLSADNSSIIRIYALYNGIIYFIQRPIFGWGTGSFATLINEYIKYPHNIFIELAMEVGLFGLLLFFIFLFIVIYNLFYLRKIINKTSHFQLLHITYLIFLFGFFNAQFSGDIAHNPLMWFAAGGVMVLRNIVLERNTL